MLTDLILNNNPDRQLIFIICRFHIYLLTCQNLLVTPKSIVIVLFWMLMDMWVLRAVKNLSCPSSSSPVESNRSNPCLLI